MLVVCVNSFNATTYLRAATELTAALGSSWSDYAAIFVAVGGCEGPPRLVEMARRVFVVTVSPNLSDHNVYPAYAYACSRGVSWPGATFVLLHDTCTLDASFARRMRELDARTDLPDFVFAHTYGLYNMGVCSHEFMLRRYADWKGVRELPKDEGIRLEQGESVVVDGATVPSLHAYSCRTLARAGPPGAIDTFSVQPSLLHGRPRFFSFVAALGVYKPYAATSSFAVPVFAGHRPTTAHERAHVLRHVSPRLASSWAPLLPL